MDGRRRRSVDDAVVPAATGEVRRQGGDDLSAAMLALYWSGRRLWLAYGMLNGATAIIVANVAVMIFVSAVAT